MLSVTKTLQHLQVTSIHPHLTSDDWYDSGKPQTSLRSSGWFTGKASLWFTNSKTPTETLDVVLKKNTSCPYAKNVVQMYLCSLSNSCNSQRNVWPQNYKAPPHTVLEQLMGLVGTQMLVQIRRERSHLNLQWTGEIPTYGHYHGSCRSATRDAESSETFAASR